jgi:Aspartyl protease
MAFAIQGEQNSRFVTHNGLILLQQTQTSPEHRCRMTSKVSATETNLPQLLIDSNHIRGYGLDVKVNGASARLMLDTGAGGILIDRMNTISPDAAREVTKVSGDSETQVKGLNGSVKNVFRGNELTLTFGHLRQKNLDIIAFDTKSIGDSAGIEVSGILGFTVLQMLDMKIDYRDGLVAFGFDPNRWRFLN